MSKSNFVHLHLHTSYSLSEGALRIPELIDLCRQHEMPAVAITDTGNLFGALEFSEACKDAGVQPIIGTSLAVELKDENAQQENGKHTSDYPRIVLLAQNEQGYKNLLKLSSESHLGTSSPESPHISLALLSQYSKGIIALSGGPDGPLNVLFANGNSDAARIFALKLSKMFPDRLYIELQRHGVDVEALVEPDLLDLALEFQLPILATNQAFFADEAMYEAHDALLCVAEGSYVADIERRHATTEHRFKTGKEMRSLFSDLPEAADNTLIVAQRCAFLVPTSAPLLPKFSKDQIIDEDDELRKRATEGLEGRLLNHVFSDEMSEPARQELSAPYRQQLDFEINVIKQMGFSGYFLIVADFIQWAKQQSIPVGPGRGSGAGSVAAWALTITDLDPLRFGLIFERFLNPDRVSMPDFDIDFCQDRRDEVIEYVRARYGDDCVAQIITFGTLQARAALRDVGRVLQLPYNLVDRICKMVPNNPASPIKLKDAIKTEPRLAEISQQEEGVQSLLDVSVKLEGLYRHASTHAAGVVISDRPLDQLVPLYRDSRSDMPVTQFSMKYAEMSGLVKFDFLGLKTLTVIERALRWLKTRDIEVDITRISLEDSKTFQMLQLADSVGVFQFESSGMRELLREAFPNKIEDLIALVALYRPGPMENIPKYIACKNGKEKPEFLHQTIEPIVADTYGVIIYQEQVMQIARVFAGYTLGEADLLRRAMGKKIKAEMAAQQEVFVNGAVNRGVDHSQAQYVFNLVDKFAGYGFNKAHSAGYALIAYQTAWLKANYPIEFYASSMSLELNNTDKLNVLRKDMEKNGFTLLPPDVNKSGGEFRVEHLGGEHGFAVRYALAAVKNVGRQAMDALAEERERNGPYKSLIDFACRINPSQINKRQLENLARAGAFDTLESNRARVFYATDYLIRLSASSQEERNTKQTNLFGENSRQEHQAIPHAEPWEEMDRLREEYSALGFYMSAHPLDAYGEVMARLGVQSYSSIVEQIGSEGKKCVLAGTVEGKQERTSARGNKFAFVQLSDLTGSYEITVFAESLSKFRHLFETGKKLVVTVDARIDDGQVRLTAQSVRDIDEAATQVRLGLEISIGVGGEKQLELVENISACLRRVAGGQSQVSLKLFLASELREVGIDLPGGYSITPQLRGELASMHSLVNVRNISAR